MAQATSPARSPEQSGQPVSGPTSRPVRDLIDRYVDERLARREIAEITARNLRQWLRSFAKVCGNRPVRQLSKRDVERWLEANPQWAPACRRTRLGGIRMFGDWLVERRYLNRNPATGIKPPPMPRTVPRALTVDQVAEILAHAPDPRARLVVLLGAQQGLRRAEIAGLEVGHLDWRNGTMIVTGKGGHERVLPITAETREAIRSYLAVHPATRGPLIRSKIDPNVGITPRAVANIMTSAAYAAGVKLRGLDGVAMHALRHTAASDMLRNGAHVRDVQQALGHAHLKTTEIYMPLLVGDLEQAMGGRRYGRSDPPAAP